jgi:hypothetical protein
LQYHGILPPDRIRGLFISTESSVLLSDTGFGNSPPIALYLIKIYKKVQEDYAKVKGKNI